MDALLPAQPAQRPSPLMFGFAETPRVAQALSHLGLEQVSKPSQLPRKPLLGPHGRALWIDLIEGRIDHATLPKICLRPPGHQVECWQR